MFPKRKTASTLIQFRERCLVLAVVVVSICSSTSVALDDDPVQREFSKFIRPFVGKYCLECHSEEEPEAGLILADDEWALTTNVAIRRWAQVSEKLAFAEMPPFGSDQPSPTDRMRVAKWLASQLETNGHNIEWSHKLLYPEYGNIVDHESLFDLRNRDSIAYSPSRLWKKSPYMFDSLLIRGLGLGKGRYGRVNGHLGKVKQPFTMEDKSGIKDFAAIMRADSATLATMLRNAEVIVDKHLGGAMHELDEKLKGPTPEDQLPKDKKGKPIRPRFPKTSDEFRAIILREESPLDEQIDAATSKMFQLVIEREPEAREQAKYRRLFRDCEAKGGHTEALRMTLIAVAISPESVYRMEIGQGTPDAYGRQMLSPANLAFAIAYALTDQKPDDQLLDAAASGRLLTRQDVKREITRIWDDESIEKPRVLRFFHEFFGYHRAPLVFKDAARFGKQYDRAQVPQKLVEDADALVMHIVRRDQQVLAELLTTDKYFISHSGNNDEMQKRHAAIMEFYHYLKDKGWEEWPYNTPKEHAAHVRKIDRLFAHPNGNVVKGWMRYLSKCDKNNVTPMPTMRQREFITAWNLDERTFDYPLKQPFVVAQDKRVGLLMHPAWLIAHSLNLDNDPVRRGKWIRERLLADAIPELPITIDARIPDEPNETLRHRFRVTREATCWRCHVKMNPLGMPFELFDDFGRWRSVEKLHARGKTKPVDSTGELIGTRDDQLDGLVEHPIELMNRLAKSKRVRQSFVRHAFRYWMGRNEFLSDSSTLIAADEAYTRNNGSFRALVISLLTSDSFLYRKRAEEASKSQSLAE